MVSFSLAATRTTAGSPVGRPRALRCARNWLAISGTVLVVAGCTGSRPAATAPAPLGVSASERVWVDSVFRSLTLRDKVAQLVWPWLLGDYVAEGSAEWGRLRALVRDQRVGGIIISVGSPLDIAAKVNALQRASTLPLLVSADMETGAGFRARGGFFTPNGIDLGGATTFPLQMALGASRDTALAYEVGRVTAREARALGIQVAFGPVLDVNNNPANPVIGARSFSEDPRLTAQLGTAFVRGVQDQGVLATGKHFPGHGDTETNSHLALSVVTADRARLDSVELLPFRAAIGAGVGAIMTFHGFLPALDSANVPATLSPRVMTELLRRDLAFTGLLVSDAMDMSGVVAQFGAFEAAKRAIAAGNDILLMPSDIKGTIDAVVAGVGEGRYTSERIDASTRRVLELKARFGLSRSRLVDLDSVRAIVGDSAHVRVADRVAERGLVLAKDSLQLVPLTGPRSRRVLAITYARRNDLGAGLRFNSELRRAVPLLRTAFANADEEDVRYESLTRAADSADLVIVSSYVNISSESATAGAPQAFSEFVRTLVARRGHVILVSFGTPYLLQQVPFVPAYVVAWGGSNASQRAAARALSGDAAIDGRLPITIPTLLPFGAGERRAPPSRSPSEPDEKN
jgi:beta-N-acetylhexosaminidase